MAFRDCIRRDEDAAYAVFAEDNPIAGAILDHHASGVGSGYQAPSGTCVAAADDAACVIAGSGNGAGKAAVCNFKVAHGLALVSHQAAHPVYAVHIRSAGTVADIAIEFPGEGTDVALLPVVADGDPGFYGAILDEQPVLSRGVAADKARIQGFGALYQGHPVEFGVVLLHLVFHIMADQAVVLDLGPIEL